MLPGDLETAALSNRSVGGGGVSDGFMGGQSQ